MNRSLREALIHRMWWDVVKLIRRSANGVYKGMRFAPRMSCRSPISGCPPSEARWLKRLKNAKGYRSDKLKLHIAPKDQIIILHNM